MPERWQQELSKIHGADFGGDLWGRIQDGPHLEAPSVTPTRSRVVAAAIALAVFVAAAIFAWNAFRPLRQELRPIPAGDVLAVPSRGEATAVFLADGSPVFVVHYPSGPVAVVDAFSPLRHDGIDQLVAWCPEPPYFVSWPQGSVFDRFGAWVGGRAAAPGLGSYAYEVIQRDAAGDPSSIEIGRLGPPNTGGHMNSSSFHNHPSACGLASGSTAGIVVHTIPESMVSASPSEAVDATSDGWIAIRGVLTPSEDGESVRLCGPGASCPGGVDVSGVDADGVRRDPAERAAQIWLVHVDHGAIVGLASLDTWQRMKEEA